MTPSSRPRFTRLALPWLRLLALAFTLAAAAPAAGAGRYADNGDGTVTDTTTGLTWDRCALGQTWTGEGCSGTAQANDGSWASATVGTTWFGNGPCHPTNDWQVIDPHLPSIRELLTIVDWSAANPAIDQTVFPNTPGAGFQSSSEIGDSAAAADYVWWRAPRWSVSFGLGNNSYVDGAAASTCATCISYPTGGTGDPHYSRNVRGTMSADPLLSLARPSADYIDHGDGSATHLPTHLTWQRCAAGQTWGDTGCEGSAATMTADQAAALAGAAAEGGWRLPSQAELLSLVDFTTQLPAINAVIFPATPNAADSCFWSASAVAAAAGRAWSVSFRYGHAISQDHSRQCSVRLVREAPSAYPLALNVSACGSGSVSSEPAGIACGDTCSADYPPDTPVTLKAQPERGASFIGWGGACTGSAPDCTVARGAARYVTAKFSAGDLFGVAAKRVEGATFPVTGKFSEGDPFGGFKVARLYLTWVYQVNPGWNLLGNPTREPLDVAGLFGETNLVESVWRWQPATGAWAFYAPGLDAAALAAYAASRHYAVLSTVEAGEGFWVHAKAAFTANHVASLDPQSVTASAATLYPGWNLIAGGDGPTPRDFANTLAGTAPAAGEVAATGGLDSLWAWNTAQARWYFYAPSLDNSGELASYAARMGYLDFGTQVLSPVSVYWARKP